MTAVTTFLVTSGVAIWIIGLSRSELLSHVSMPVMATSVCIGFAAALLSIRSSAG